MAAERRLQNLRKQRRQPGGHRRDLNTAKGPRSSLACRCSKEGVADCYTLTVEGVQAQITPAKPSEVFERLHHLVPGLMTGEIDPHQERLDAALDDPR